jgi:hypothetical protein
VFTYSSRDPKEYTENGVIVEVEAERDKTDYVFPLKVNSGDVYYYQIVGLNGIGEESVSDVHILHVCTKASVIEPPTLLHPLSTETKVSVLNPTFEWQLSPETVTIKCGSSEVAFLTLEIGKKSPDQDFSISLSVSLLTTKLELPSDHLLSLSTDYSWRLTVSHQESAFEPATTVSSDVMSFTTVSKHCSYVKCHRGFCDDNTVVLLI